VLVRSEEKHPWRAEPPPPPTPTGFARTLKYALDRVLAACGLLVVAPLFATVAFALHYRGGAVLARRLRLREDGRRFELLAFPITPDMRRDGAWRMLARAGVDALPQLWNVLRGDLSLVGPRPRPLDLDPPPARPGLTGPAQLAALAGPVSQRDVLQLEARYARTWSLAGDIRILLRTMTSLLS
jgi:lipopolysaccharide/colanic/teichoic acid biosynthesis glycosyltransferase